MIDSYLRQHYQKNICTPFAKTLSNLRISPNVYTVGALISGTMILPILAFKLPFSALFLLILSGFLDTLDGTVARLKNQTSRTGAAFDIVSDRIVELSIILGLYSVSPEERSWLSLLMLGSAFICVTTFLVVGIFTANDGEKSFHYSPGIMERGEAFLFFGLLILFPSLFVPLACLFIFLVFLTATIRILQFVNTP